MAEKAEIRVRVGGEEKLFPVREVRTWHRLPEKLWGAGVCAHAQMGYSWSPWDTIPCRNSPLLAINS